MATKLEQSPKDLEGLPTWAKVAKMSASAMHIAYVATYSSYILSPFCFC